MNFVYEDSELPLSRIGRYKDYKDGQDLSSNSTDHL